MFNLFNIIFRCNGDLKADQFVLLGKNGMVKLADINITDN